MLFMKNFKLFIIINNILSKVIASPYLHKFDKNNNHPQNIFTISNVSKTLLVKRNKAPRPIRNNRFVFEGGIYKGLKLNKVCKTVAHSVCK